MKDKKNPKNFNKTSKKKMKIKIIIVITVKRNFFYQIIPRGKKHKKH